MQGVSAGEGCAFLQGKIFVQTDVRSVCKIWSFWFGGVSGKSD